MTRANPGPATAPDQAELRSAARWHASRPLTIGVGVWFALTVVWLALSSATPGTGSPVADLAVLLPGCAIVVASLMAARRCAADPRTASAWRWLAVATTCQVAGFAVLLGYDIVGAIAPFPSAADAGFLAAYVFFLIGVLRFPIRAQSRAGERRLLIDGAIIAIGATSVIWFLVLGPTITASGRTLLQGASASAYPVGDLLETFAVIYVLMSAPALESRRALQLLALGAMTMVTGNVVFTWSTSHGHTSVLLITSIAFSAGQALFFLAAANQAPLDARPRSESAQGGYERETPAANRFRGLAYVAPVISFGLLFVAQFDSPRYQRIGLAVCAASVTALVLVRQFLAQRDLLSAQGQLSYQAMHDALTGLPNRALVLDRADQLMARARRQRLPVAALFVDIDGFKHVNDTFGHATGDELLKAVAGRLAGVVRDSDTVGRMGGDEFVVLLDSPTLDVAPELIAERMLEVLREPVVPHAAGARPITVTGSIGIAVAVTDSASQLLANADMALYQAKANGKDCAAVFESSMQTAAQDRLLLEMDLRGALENAQFFLMYQPTFDLRSERVTGVEALLRWRHPTRGVMAPDLFIPIAEETGIIVPVGQWVLREACHQAASWHADGHVVGMSVNVSARQLDKDHELVEHVRAALRDSGLEPSALTLEITETALMHDPDEAAERLGALKSLGVRLAIDDFGTGYSSMAYLRQFPVDALKIDRSFISGIALASGSTEIVHSLVQLGKTLGLETLGEGIEDPAQLRNLQLQQCDSGQGFLFARPLEPHEIPEFIARASGPQNLASRTGA